MSTLGLVGTAEHYAAFVKLCRLRIEQLGITYETVDEICGFPTRYTGKLLTGAKGMSAFSLFTLARALALLPAFHHDGGELIRLQRHSAWVLMTKPWRKRDHLAAGKHIFDKHSLLKDLRRNAGQRGGLMRAKKLTRRQRKLIAQRAAQIRWQNERAAAHVE